MNQRCPVKVVKSCRTKEQLYVADRYARLWLKNNRLSYKSATAEVIFRAVHSAEMRLSMRLMKQGLPWLLVLVLMGCGRETPDAERFRERSSQASVFCASLQESALEPFRSGCYAGFMAHCTEVSCNER